MTTLILPDPIAAYFAANKQTVDVLARCFTPQAVVKDEGRLHSGHEAIKAWKADVSAKYTYTSEPFSLEQRDGWEIVRIRTTGNFAGSPVDLEYRFRLEGGLIASLEIGA